MNARVLLFLAVFPSLAVAQGFAGLGSDAEGFSVPERGTPFDFPADHGPHPDFRIEWWYVTANLTGPDGADYGLQWTLFRSAVAPEAGDGWSAPQIWLGHAAVTTSGEHFVAERFARGGVGQAGATGEPFEAWIDDWVLRGDWQTFDMRGTGADFGFDVQMTANGPLVLHGEDGYSVKSASGQASYYYSQPFLSVQGTITLPDGDVAVTGQAWIDREWSSQPLAEDQTGWDWFSLSFDDGNKLMGFRLRQRDGTYFTAGTWITPDGLAAALPNGAFDAEPLSFHQSPGATIPTEWQVTLQEHGVNISVKAINPDAWMETSIPYWEGPVRLSGSHTGVGYLEMTGYE